jgi:hypothetical protein
VLGGLSPSQLPELYHLPGESHLAMLGRAEDILAGMTEIRDRHRRR